MSIIETIEMKTCDCCDIQYEEWYSQQYYNGVDGYYCKCCMINEKADDEVWCVQTASGDFIGGDDKNYMYCIDDCWRAINDYHYKNNGIDAGDEISIILQSKLDEDILGELGIEYRYRVLYTIRPYETLREKVMRESRPTQEQIDQRNKDLKEQKRLYPSK